MGRWAVVLAVVALLAPGVARAGTVEVLVDSTDVTLHTANGATTGTVTVANLSSDRTIPVDASVVAQTNCFVTTNPPSVRPGRRAQVTLEFGNGCKVDNGAKVALDFGTGTTPPTVDVNAVPAAPTQKPHWHIIFWSFAIAAGVALAVVLLLEGWMVIRNRKRKPGSERIGLGTKLTGLGTSWSFKDNWVNSITLGTGALVAVLAASNVLTAVLGEEPKAALALLAVDGAIAAGVVAVSPLFPKMIGHDQSVSTVLGMLVAAAVTLLGSLGQAIAVTWQGWDLVSSWRAVQWVVLAAGIIVVLVVVGYALNSLSYYIEYGSQEKPKEPSDIQKASELIAAAIKDAGGGGGAALDVTAADLWPTKTIPLLAEYTSATPQPVHNVLL